MSKNAKISFKTALENISDIVSKLESDDCELEDMANLYEKGVLLLKFCEDKINDTKTKIEQINAGEHINKDKIESNLFFNNEDDQS